MTVLSAADPVRVFQEFATLDLLSNGRAEIVAGRGSFIEAYPLFGLDLKDYDSLFAEKLELLLQLREQTEVHWSGKHRAPLTGQSVYPRPLQPLLPVWLGVGGTPASFARAGALGLPLMVAIIGGEPHRFRPLIDLYREAGRRAGHPAESLKVGLHMLGYVAKTKEEAADAFFPGYAHAFTEIGKERGWPTGDAAAVRCPARAYRGAGGGRSGDGGREDCACKRVAGRRCPIELPDERGDADACGADGCDRAAGHGGGSARAGTTGLWV